MAFNQSESKSISNLDVTGFEKFIKFVFEDMIGFKPYSNSIINNNFFQIPRIKFTYLSEDRFKYYKAIPYHALQRIPV